MRIKTDWTCIFFLSSLCTLLPAEGATGYVITDCPIRPENWKVQYGKNRCRRSCLLDVDCGPKHQCICDQECGLSCIRKGSQCSLVITGLANGHVRYPKEAIVGSSIKYECSAGYRLVGPTRRVCQGNRLWSGWEPSCTTSDKCTKPPELPYARHNASEGIPVHDVNTILRYECTKGYHADDGGFQLAKCLMHKGSAEWFGPDIKCTGMALLVAFPPFERGFIVKARSCGHPGEVLNAVRLGEQFTYPNTVTYRCIDGFYLRGSSTLTCAEDGRWVGEKPTCKPIECPRPKAPLYGQVQGTSVDFQSKVVYSCEEGYRMVGQKQRICQSDRSWSGMEPYCEEVSCPTLGVLWNGFIDGDETSFGAMVIFRCLEGMTHLGAPYSRCQKDGSWSHPLPSCMAPCQMPKLSNGLIMRDDLGEPVPHGEHVTIRCASFHELEYSESPVCNNGSWSHLPRCVPIRCRKWPEPVRNGYVLFAKTHHGAMARFVCHPGYQLKGPPIIRCSFGEWKGIRPVCTEKHCPHPKTVIGDIEHGLIKLEGSLGSYEYKDYIRAVGEHRTIAFECHRGYVLEGPAKATCVNGTWQPNVRPRCVLQTHPSLSNRIDWDVIVRDKRHLNWKPIQVIRHSKEIQQAFEKGSILRENSFKRKRINNDVRSLSDRFAILTDSGKAELENKLWVSSPACTLPTRANSFFVIANQIVTYGEEVPDGTTVRIHCSPGHLLEGSPENLCFMGTWKSSFGECFPIPSPMEANCPPPADSDRVAVVWLPPLEQINNGSTYESAAIRRIAVDNGSFANRRYPNASIVKYACQRSEHNRSARQRPQAMSVQCVDGRWVALLRPCFSMESRELEPTVRRFSTESSVAVPSPLSGSSLPSIVRRSRRCLRPDIRSPWHVVAYLSNSKTNKGVGKSQVKSTYRQGATVYVRCSTNNLTSWTKCVGGRWSELDENLCKNASNDQPLIREGDCLFNPLDFVHMTVSSVDSGEQFVFTQHLPEGTELTLRCEHVGLFQLVGPGRVLCRNGSWFSSSPKPYCRPVGRPPAIIFRTVQGDASPSSSGDLIVRRSSTLQLDCLYPMDKGQPAWHYTSSYRQYPQHWVNVSVDMDRFRDSHASMLTGNPITLSAYRLTVYMARPEDSGTFYCVDSIGRRHAIRVIIKDISCPLLNQGQAMIVKTTKGNYFGSVVDLKCRPGFRLVGASRLRCLESGRWSQVPLPQCQAIQCSPIRSSHPALMINVSSYEYNGIAIFQCKTGFTVDGPRYIQCTSHGQWSEDPPNCAVVRCTNPDVPTGAVLVPRKTHYYYRDIVLFSCSSGYLLTGKNYAICNKHGIWTNSAPECLRFCWFPGQPVFGDTTSPPKAYYLVGDTIVYYCISNKYRMEGNAVTRCTGTGKWSSSVPSCKPQRPT
ncbi:hypothetical protein M514_03325 [Trichuris suis]|uniref:Sushi domain-containing protein n=1 Tax=Trichuris suis TaxID=68888 RepID=A0A085NL79_9BILA|nr:hypothetical protein M514_03325 [Trichuris suis]